jgi:hypothetical protein
VDGQRYWYSTQPSVTRLAQDRAAQQTDDLVFEEIRRRLRQEGNTRGDFARVHICPATSADIPDEHDARLVLLDPNYAHVARVHDSPALTAAKQILDSRGSGPRLYRNTVVFLAADKARLDELKDAVRQFLAWNSIEKEHETLNLDPFQANQARTKREQADQTIKTRIPETYTWLLVPTQDDPHGSMDWREFRLQGQDALAVRAAKKLRNEELLMTQLAGTRLRLELDRIPLWRDDQVSLKDLAEYFAQNLYLPRLKDTALLLEAIGSGVANLTWEQETFAYADRWDAAQGRYVGLKTGEYPTVVLDGQSLVVKPGAARRQRDAEIAATLVPATRTPGVEPPYVPDPPRGAGNGGTGTSTHPMPPSVAEAADPHRFHGTIRLQPMKMSGQVGTIAQEIVQHLVGLLGSQVEITLEIQATLPTGAPSQVVRTVTENCRTLGFEPWSGFEKE